MFNRISRNIYRVLGIGFPHYRSILLEAKEAGYNFRLYQGNEIFNFPCAHVDIYSDNIVFIADNTKLSIPFSQINEVQTLVKSKTVNVILQPSIMWVFLLMVAPILGFLVIEYKEQLAQYWWQFLVTFESSIPERQYPILAEYYLKGFGAAIIYIGSISFMLSTFILLRLSQSTRFRAASAGRLQIAIKQLEQVIDKEEEYFARLINVNLTNIEAYYILVKTQTDKSFLLTLSCAIAGFIVLIFGILLSFQQGINQPATALTIASGALIEFISAIFFYLYNKTIQQLNAYHDKLIDVQDTMLALKVSQGIKNDEALKNQTLRYLTQVLTNRLANIEIKADTTQQIDGATKQG